MTAAIRSEERRHRPDAARNRPEDRRAANRERAPWPLLPKPALVPMDTWPPGEVMEWDRSPPPRRGFSSPAAIPAGPPAGNAPRRDPPTPGKAKAPREARVTPYHPRQRLDQQGYVPAMSPGGHPRAGSPSSPPTEPRVVSHLPDRTSTSSRGDTRIEVTLPIRTTGVMFGGLVPIPTNPEVDPPAFACLNCWQRGHQKSRCPQPLRPDICLNCGRRGVRLMSCPRCSTPHREYLLRTWGPKLPRGRSQSRPARSLSRGRPDRPRDDEVNPGPAECRSPRPETPPTPPRQPRSHPQQPEESMGSPSRQRTVPREHTAEVANDGNLQDVLRAAVRLTADLARLPTATQQRVLDRIFSLQEEASSRSRARGRGRGTRRPN